MIFFYPEKPMRIRKIEDVPEGYFVEVKKNGHRIEILCEDNELKLLSREGTPLKAGKNFNWEWLKDVFPQPFYLDGECIGARQKGDVSDTIVIWDAIILNGERLIKENLVKRYYKLTGFKYYSVPDVPEVNNKKSFGTELLAKRENTEIYLSLRYPKEYWNKLWSKLDCIYDEGLVFKNPNAILDWNIFSTKKSINQLKLKIKDE